MKITFDFENCFGIRRLQKEIEFKDKQSVAVIYAPNGMMKSSFANTCDYMSKVEEKSKRGKAPKDPICDRLNPDAPSKHVIQIDGVDIPPQCIFVANPDNDYDASQQVTAFLASVKLKKEYDRIIGLLDKASTEFVKALKGISKSSDCDDSNFSTIQKELLFILQFAKEHPNSGMVARLLSKLLNRIEDDGMEKDNPRVLISITVETMMTSPRVFNVGTALISCFLSKIEEGKEEILRSVYSKLRRLSNTGELDIWLQRITYHLNDVNIAYDEGLTKVVAGQPGVSLWNNEWVKPELLQGFPLMSICDVQKRNDQTPIIPAAEVSIFEY